MIFSHPALFAAVFLVGCCMDSLSGAPLGLYTATYLWIFITVQFLKRFVHPGNFILLPLISAFAVMLESGFLFFSFFVRYGISALSIPDFILAGRQIMWGGVIIPIAVVLVGKVHEKCEKLDARKL